MQEYTVEVFKNWLSKKGAPDSKIEKMLSTVTDKVPEKIPNVFKNINERMLKKIWENAIYWKYK